MIQLSGAGKRFGHKLLFENLNWLITSKDRAGLVGANGTGKPRCSRPWPDSRRWNTGRSVSRAAPVPATCHRMGCRSPAALSLANVCRSLLPSARWSRKWKSSLTKWPSLIRREWNTLRWPTVFISWIANSARAMAMPLRRKLGTVLAGLGFPAFGLAAPHRRVFRRLADAYRAGEAPAGETQPAFAG